ncbi:hypothetical protein ACIQGZ_16900 [Streptomyces sp. NPDC092296]|uniref:hypothetical protein n=1 Tax=Streptomyces sp. NPDC092296 TaxID=3366012 RepID=UPI00382ACD9B
MTVPSTDHATALELERMRGEIGTGLAEIKGQLALLVQRSDQVDRTLATHGSGLVDLDKRTDALETASAGLVGVPARVASLEQWRWTMTGAAMVLGAGAGYVASYLSR